MSTLLPPHVVQNLLAQASVELLSKWENNGRSFDVYPPTVIPQGENNFGDFVNTFRENLAATVRLKGSIPTLTQRDFIYPIVKAGDWRDADDNQFYFDAWMPAYRNGKAVLGAPLRKSGREKIVEWMGLRFKDLVVNSLEYWPTYSPFVRALQKEGMGVILEPDPDTPFGMYWKAYQGTEPGLVSLHNELPTTPISPEVYNQFHAAFMNIGAINQHLGDEHSPSPYDQVDFLNHGMFAYELEPLIKQARVALTNRVKEVNPHFSHEHIEPVLDVSTLNGYDLISAAEMPPHVPRMRMNVDAYLNSVMTDVSSASALDRMASLRSIWSASKSISDDSLTRYRERLIALKAQHGNAELMTLPLRELKRDMFSELLRGVPNYHTAAQITSDPELEKIVRGMMEHLTPSQVAAFKTDMPEITNAEIEARIAGGQVDFRNENLRKWVNETHNPGVATYVHQQPQLQQPQPPSLHEILRREAHIQELSQRVEAERQALDAERQAFEAARVQAQAEHAAAAELLEQHRANVEAQMLDIAERDRLFQQALTDVQERERTLEQDRQALAADQNALTASQNALAEDRRIFEAERDEAIVAQREAEGQLEANRVRMEADLNANFEHRLAEVFGEEWERYRDNMTQEAIDALVVEKINNPDFRREHNLALLEEVFPADGPDFQLVQENGLFIDAADLRRYREVSNEIGNAWQRIADTSAALNEAIDERQQRDLAHNLREAGAQFFNTLRQINLDRAALTAIRRMTLAFAPAEYVGAVIERDREREEAIAAAQQRAEAEDPQGWHALLQSVADSLTAGQVGPAMELLREHRFMRAVDDVEFVDPRALPAPRLEEPGPLHTPPPAETPPPQPNPMRFNMDETPGPGEENPAFFNEAVPAPPTPQSAVVSHIFDHSQSAGRRRHEEELARRENVQVLDPNIQALVAALAMSNRTPLITPSRQPSIKRSGFNQMSSRKASLQARRAKKRRRRPAYEGANLSITRSTGHVTLTGSSFISSLRRR